MSRECALPSPRQSHAPPRSSKLISNVVIIVEASPRHWRTCLRVRSQIRPALIIIVVVLVLVAEPPCPLSTLLGQRVPMHRCICMQVCLLNGEGLLIAFFFFFPFFLFAAALFFLQPCLVRRLLLAASPNQSATRKFHHQEHVAAVPAAREAHPRLDSRVSYAFSRRGVPCLQLGIQPFV
mmetsp:Transcript_87374/g.182838  ORF Transcript_87374/g.182838 Transcript_87374/m.182838 type:complete len:180 (+) Transcript_87374:89-628(+)